VSLQSCVGGWLKDIRISQVSEWDVLMFLYRKGTSLAHAARIAHLVGYGESAVDKALASLVSLGLVKRSPSFQGARLFRFVMPLDSTQKESIRQLLKLSEKRSGRLMVVRGLRGRATSSAHMAAGMAVKKEG
jgi:DNA-binding MarR family transcriptional regulator